MELTGTLYRLRTIQNTYSANRVKKCIQIIQFSVTAYNKIQNRYQIFHMPFFEQVLLQSISFPIIRNHPGSEQNHIIHAIFITDSESRHSDITSATETSR